MHRWLALIVGGQVLLWFASGLVMALLPIDTVHGDHRVDRQAEPPLAPGTRYAATDALLAAAGGPVRQLEHRMLLGRPIVEARLADGGIRLLDAATAAPLAAVDAATARRIAVAAHRGGGVRGVAVTRVERAGGDYRGPLPAWRVAFADDDSTRLYVAADTGRIASVRTGTWRLYDFFWGLHIMDWTQRERFNTPWLRAFAFTGLVFGLAGAILLAMRWPRRRRR